MSQVRIAAIVEGDGEVGAVPVLLRRHADLLGWHGRLHIPPPIRQPASRLLKPGQLERIVELAALKLRGPGGILLLLDSEDDCPAELGPKLLGRVRQARPDLPTSVVLAYREYEAWFLGAAASLAGRRGLPAELQPPAAPESIRNCKEWLSRQMPHGEAYNEVDDQPALTAGFDFDAARSACASFDKCHRELTQLLRRAAAMTPDFDPATT